MEQEKKDKIVQTLIDILEKHGYGSEAESLRVAVVIEPAKDKVSYEASERS
jgi:hypothetical protein